MQNLGIYFGVDPQNISDISDGPQKCSDYPQKCYAKYHRSGRCEAPAVQPCFSFASRTCASRNMVWVVDVMWPTVLCRCVFIDLFPIICVILCTCIDIGLQVSPCHPVHTNNWVGFRCVFIPSHLRCSIGEATNCRVHSPLASLVQAEG